jgi:UDP-N-acetylmuramate dehydrogenase
MQISKNVSLKKYNTFGIDCSAEMLIELTHTVDLELLPELIGNINFLIIGSGSNLLFTSDFSGVIIHLQTNNIKIFSDSGNEVLVYADAGVLWDDFVNWCVGKGYGGVENLSLIPGTVGAVPVQNIGAYGVEAADVIGQVAVLDTVTGEKVVFSREACKFSYRDSIFKSELKRKYLITGVWFRLMKNPLLNTGYGTLHDEVARTGTPSVRTVRAAVIKIRQSKLPDPKLIGNAGSFFKNPVMEAERAEKIARNYPEAPIYEAGTGLKKVAAGWLIEKCGWKGKRFGDAGVHEKQALVLVNYGKAKGRDILKLSEDIRKSVADKFEIWLEKEVEVIGPEL